MINHDEVTKVMTSQGAYGTGVTPNPYWDKQPEIIRRTQWRQMRKLFTEKIEALTEPRFITPIETAECIEALITMTDSRKILEIGTCTGYTALHMLRAIVGKGHVTSIDPRPAHDVKFFTHPDVKPWFRHIEGWTPAILSTLVGNTYDLVFVDSDHSLDHCQKELVALLPITRKGSLILFHDCPERQSPQHPPQEQAPIFKWLHEKVQEGYFRGTCFPTAHQADCVATWGEGYPIECSPGLGVFVRL